MFLKSCLSCLSFDVKMSQNQATEIKKYLRIARKCLIASRYDEALAHFICLCKIQPSLKSEVEGDFMTSLCKCSEVLEQRGELRKILACFQEASSIFPYNEALLSKIGGTLFRLGFPDESASFFRQALHLNPNNIQAKQCLENISNTLVERWHFRMLNDRGRNTAYKHAITKAIASGYDVVLDIGSGSGILSMFAVQAGAKEVFACELSKTMYEVSQDVLKANNMESHVHLINKKSTDMVVGRDIPTRVSLVVTETMDCGLLGEGILKTMSHAWEQLMLPCNGNVTNFKQPASKVIPSGASLYGMVISAPDIRAQCRSKVMISEINMSSVNIIGGDQLDHEGDPWDLVNDPIETYTTESLSLLHHGYSSLSDPFLIAEYNFSDASGINNKMKLKCEVPVMHSGSIDAIAVWFDLHLDQDIHISTSPEDRSLCWEQAVFPVFPHHIRNLQTQVIDNEVLVMTKKGDTLVIKGIVDQEYLKIQCTEVCSSKDNVENNSKETMKSMEFDQRDVESSSTEETPQISQKQHNTLVDYGIKDDITKVNLESNCTEIQDLNTEQIGCYAKTGHITHDNDEDKAKQVVNLSSKVHTHFCSEQKGEEQDLGSSTSQDYRHQDNRNVHPLSTETHSLRTQGLLFKEQDLKEPRIENEQVGCSQSFSPARLNTTSAVEEQENREKRNLVSPNVQENGNADGYHVNTWKATCQAVIPHSYMARANDDIYISSYIKVVRSFIEEISSMRGIKCCIIEHSLGLPVFALEAAKLNETKTLITNPAIPTDVIDQLIESNNITGEMHYGTLEEIAQVGRHWDIFVTDLIEPSGILRHQGIEDIALTRGCLLKKHAGVVIPRAITALSMCIESDSLISLSRVQNDENTLDLKIGSFMNEFQASTQINIDMTTLDFRPLSEKFDLFEMDFMSECNGEEQLLELLELRSEMQVKIDNAGVIHALPYWFTVALDKHTSLSTYSCGYVGSHWKQAIYVLDKGLTVKQGDLVTVSTSVKESNITLNVTKDK